MARINLNFALQSAHGKVGDIVIKKYKYGEVLSRLPRMGQVPPSEKQVAQHGKWSAAAEYYQRVKADPALIACYARARKKTGYPLPALTNRDFHQPPKVDYLRVDQYRGKAGDVIEIGARDDICVVAVVVTLRDTAGEVLESGQAVSEFGYAWRYAAKTNAPSGGVITIEAVAQDLPGNRASRSTTWGTPAARPWDRAMTQSPWPNPRSSRQEQIVRVVCDRLPGPATALAAWPKGGQIVRLWCTPSPPEVGASGRE